MTPGDGTVRVASREHPLQVKRGIGRPPDLPDVEALLALDEGGRP